LSGFIHNLFFLTYASSSKTQVIIKIAEDARAQCFEKSKTFRMFSLQKNDPSASSMPFLRLLQRKGNYPPWQGKKIGRESQINKIFFYVQ